jgi:hypothetical protein
MNEEAYELRSSLQPSVDSVQTPESGSGSGSRNGNGREGGERGENFPLNKIVVLETNQLFVK